MGKFRPSAHAAAIRFAPPASRRYWTRFVCVPDHLRETIPAAEWRAVNCGWEWFQHTWTPLSISNSVCQQQYRYLHGYISLLTETPISPPLLCLSSIRLSFLDGT